MIKCRENNVASLMQNCGHYQILHLFIIAIPINIHLHPTSVCVCGCDEMSASSQHCQPKQLLDWEVDVLLAVLISER